MTRSLTTAVLALVAFLALVPLAAAHHGWSWTTGNNIELIGVVSEARLGLPHGVLKVDAEGDIWTVEVGQPWRNERAGLTAGDLAVGAELRIIGEPSADVSQRLLKAEKIYIGEREYVLYSNRN